MADFRALCAELHAAVQLYTGQNPAAAGIPANELVARLMDAMANTAAALAQPEPQGPSDEDLDALFTEVDQSGESESWRTYARAALARWGRPAIEPVPVSERLPGPEDCDEEGLCWWWDSDCRQTEAWCRGLSEYASGSYSHWLPHWALPVPGVEGADA
jgi:hypothetical protein